MAHYEIFRGASVGFLIQFFPQYIKKARNSSITTPTIFDRLENTIVRITPLILQIEEIQKDLDESTGKVIIEDLNILLHKIARLLEEYAKLNHIDFLQRHRYKKQIIELEASLKRIIEVDVPINRSLYIKQMMNEISQNHNFPESKIDFHAHWTYKTKEHRMRFVVK